jgi:hypothetical protein
MKELDRVEIGVALPQNTPDAALGIRAFHNDEHTLDTREMADDLPVEPRDRLEPSWPIRFFVRPGEPRSLMRFKLGGHAEAARRHESLYFPFHRFRIGP